MSDDTCGDLILLVLGAHRPRLSAQQRVQGLQCPLQFIWLRELFPASLSFAGVRGSLGNETSIFDLCREWGKGCLVCKNSIVIDYLIS